MSVPSKILLFAFVLPLCCLCSCQNIAPGTPSEASDSVVVRSHVRAVETSDGMGEQAMETLQTLFALVLSDAHDSAAHYIAYRGLERSDDFTRAFNYASPDERVEVDKVCTKIKVMLHNLAETRFLEFSTENESEGEWQVWQVEFVQADGNSTQAAFALLDAQGQLLLGDID